MEKRDKEGGGNLLLQILDELAEVKSLLLSIIDDRHQNEKRAELDLVESLGPDALLSHLKAKNKEYDQARRRTKQEEKQKTKKNMRITGTE